MTRVAIYMPTLLTLAARNGQRSISRIACERWAGHRPREGSSIARIPTNFTAALAK